MTTLDDFAAGKLADLSRAQLKRALVDTDRLDGITVERNGRRLLSFSCNDYLNFSHHPEVKAAAIEAVSRYGVGAGASRLVTGNHPLLGQLEQRLARLKGAEAACVFGSGYLANSGIIAALAGRDDLVILDELAHACLWAGGQLSKAKVVTFRHNDLADLESLLHRHRAEHPHVLIGTDGVFSMDGDLAPLVDMGALARRYDAWLLADDAHGIGVVGGGRGSTYMEGTKADIPLQMGTLSKAIGGYGGYLCASRPVIEFMHNRARTFVYSTGLPPASVAAAIAAIDIIIREPELAARPVQKARAFTRRVGLPDAQSPIVPVVLGSADAALAASRLLEAEGFMVVAIRPPTVPEGTARLRFAFTAGHPDAEIERLADVMRNRVLASAA